MSNDNILINEQLIEDAGISVKESQFNDFFNTLSESDKNALTDFVMNKSQLRLRDEDDYDVLMTRFIVVSKVLPTEIISKFFTTNSESDDYFQRLIDKAKVSMNEFGIDNSYRIINNLMINMALMNTGKIYKDITDQVSDVGMSIDDISNTEETSFTAVQVLSNAKIESATSFNQMITDSLSLSGYSLKSFNEINEVKSDMVEMLTDGESDHMDVIFQSNGKMKIYIMGEEVNPLIIGEMYYRYTSNYRRCREKHGFIGFASSEELLEGVDYDEVYDYLLATGDLTKEDLSTSDSSEDMEVSIEPHSVVMIMNGVQVFQKPVGILFKNSNSSSIKSGDLFFIPALSNISEELLAEQKIRINAPVTKSIAEIPKMKNIFMLNPSLYKMCKEQPSIVKNMQVSEFSIKELAKELNARVVSSIDEINTIAALKAVLGV